MAQLSAHTDLPSRPAPTLRVPHPLRFSFLQRVRVCLALALWVAAFYPERIGEGQPRRKKRL
jgi:hypothetical protein